MFVLSAVALLHTISYALSSPARAESATRDFEVSVLSLESPLWDPETVLDTNQVAALTRMLHEHRILQGETLRVAVIRQLPASLDPEPAARALLESWNRSPNFIRRREAVLLFVLSSGRTSLAATVDLEDRLDEDTVQRLVNQGADALRESGPAAGAGSALRGLLLALESPLLEEGQSEADLEMLMIGTRQDTGPSRSVLWMLVALLLMTTISGTYLVMSREIQISSGGIAKAAPHQTLRRALPFQRGRRAIQMSVTTGSFP
ncbi:MAG: hypothetical protein IT285_07620 [Bdellovibrionales bacterium]|nr:hypothetical protein [Bdellovibrionales bacterium]